MRRRMKKTNGGDLESYLVVIRTIRGFFYARIFPLITHLNANHGVHVETRELSSFYHSYADLIVLGLQRTLSHLAALKVEL